MYNDQAVQMTQFENDFWIVFTLTDVNECHSNPCQHGGTCSQDIGLYTCTCDTAYTGLNCEVGE